jgi:hypothetical protein
MMSLNDLPTIIDDAGTYQTRGGKTVYIHEVKQNSNPKTTSFDGKGTISYIKPGNVRHTQEYNIWHVSGRISVFDPCDNDIVSKKVLAL